MTAQALHTQEAEASSILRATRAAIPIEMQMTAQLGLEEEMHVEGENDNKAARVGVHFARDRMGVKRFSRG